MEFTTVQLRRRQRVFRKSGTVRRAVAATVVFAAAVSAAVALESSAANPGLHGILGKEVPNDLGPDAYTGLNGNWEKWGKGLSELVAKLYTDEKLDLDGQRALIKELQGKIRTMDRALADPRYASLADALTTVRGRLARRLDIASAILDTLAMKPEDVKTEKVKEAQSDALESLGDLESDLSHVQGGSAWLPYIRAQQLRQALTNGGSDNVVSAVKQKLDGAGSLKNAAQRQFLSRPAFKDLQASLNRVMDVQAAHYGGVDEKAERGKMTALVAAIEGYEDEGSSSDGQKVREALVAAEKASIDGGTRLGQAVRKHYMNYNLQIVANDAALSKIMADHQTTNGPVTDFVLGANVSGQETTTTDVAVQLEPDAKAADIGLVISGITQSNTVGVTSEASIYTYGYHRFSAVKPILFDGNTISTAPAKMTYVQPNNQTTGASTRMSGVPIFGGIANGIAMREAEARRGESEAIAAQRIETRVLPEVDAKVDKLIKEANNRYQTELKKRMEKGGVLPASIRARSNQGYLRLSAEIASPNELAGDVTNTAGDTAAGLVLHMHESLLNNAARNLDFAGKTMNDAEIKARLESYLTLLAGRPIKIGDKGKSSPEDEKSSLVFDKEDAIRFTIENGEINIVIRAGFKQEGKEDIPPQVITVPLKLSLKGNHVMVDRGTVLVSAGSAGGDRATQVVRAGVMRKKLESVIQPMALDGMLHITRTGKPEVNLAIAKVRAQNGWLTMWAN